jgi:hypothetical protein
MPGDFLKKDLAGMYSTAEFASLATWQPDGDAVVHAADVILSEPDAMVLNEGAVLPDVVITLPFEKFSAIDIGDTVCVGDRRFQVTKPPMRSSHGLNKVLECVELNEYEVA